MRNRSRCSRPRRPSDSLHRATAADGQTHSRMGDRQQADHRPTTTTTLDAHGPAPMPPLPDLAAALRATSPPRPHASSTLSGAAELHHHHHHHPPPLFYLHASSTLSGAWSQFSSLLVTHSSAQGKQAGRQGGGSGRRSSGCGRVQCASLPGPPHSSELANCACRHPPASGCHAVPPPPPPGGERPPPPPPPQALPARRTVPSLSTSASARPTSASFLGAAAAAAAARGEGGREGMTLQGWPQQHPDCQGHYCTSTLELSGDPDQNCTRGAARRELQRAQCRGEQVAKNAAGVWGWGGVKVECARVLKACERRLARQGGRQVGQYQAAAPPSQGGLETMFWWREAAGPMPSCSPACSPGPATALPATCRRRRRLRAARRAVGG